MPNKQQILDSLTAIAKRLGRAPSRAEFITRSGISLRFVLRWFPSWSATVRAAGLRPYALNVRIDDRLLLEDWGRAVRKHRAVPPRRVYLVLGKYNPSTLAHRFGAYSSMPEAFRDFAKGHRQWADVLALIPAPVSSSPFAKLVRTRLPNHAPAFLPPKTWPVPRPGQPTYGNPTQFRWLPHEPMNELGVVLLFGMLAKDLGYLIENVQNGFPDCEAKRQVGPGRWQRIRIEFEFESRNFREHAHPADGCDLIVCWRHNWPACPTHLEVLELSHVLNAQSGVREPSSRFSSG